MNRIVGWAAVLAAVTAFAGTTQAADISRPPPPVSKAPAFVEPAPFSWAGFYLGANVGYGWTDGDGTLTLAPPFPVTLPVTGDGDGFFGGFQIGYNWQAGSFVYGIETDFQLSAGDGTVRFVPGPTFGNVDNEWFGTIRARLGYAVDTWLFYVTGGGAYTHNKLSAAGFGSASKTGWTWTVGGGIEAAFWQNWSAKVEYLYLSTPSDVPVIPGFSIDGDTNTHLVRLGVNYHFPW